MMSVFNSWLKKSPKYLTVGSQEPQHSSSSSTPLPRTLLGKIDKPYVLGGWGQVSPSISQIFIERPLEANSGDVKMTKTSPCH